MSTSRYRVVGVRYPNAFKSTFPVIPLICPLLVYCQPRSFVGNAVYCMVEPYWAIQRVLPWMLELLSALFR